MFDEWAGVIAIVLAAAVLAVAVVLTAQAWSVSAETSKKLSLRVIADAVPYNGSWTLAVFNLGPPANITGVWTSRGFVPIGEVLEKGERLMLSVADQPFKVQACALPTSPLSCELVEVAGWSIYMPIESMKTATVIIDVGGCGDITCSFTAAGVISGVLENAHLWTGEYKWTIPVLGQSILTGGCTGNIDIDGNTVYYSEITYSNFTGIHVLYPDDVLRFKVVSVCGSYNISLPSSSSNSSQSSGCTPSVRIDANIPSNPNGQASASVNTCGASVVKSWWEVWTEKDESGKLKIYLVYIAELDNGDVAWGFYWGKSACQQDTSYEVANSSSITIECGRK